MALIRHAPPRQFAQATPQFPRIHGRKDQSLIALPLEMLVFAENQQTGLSVTRLRAGLRSPSLAINSTSCISNVASQQRLSLGIQQESSIILSPRHYLSIASRRLGGWLLG